MTYAVDLVCASLSVVRADVQSAMVCLSFVVLTANG